MISLGLASVSSLGVTSAFSPKAFLYAGCYDFSAAFNASNASNAPQSRSTSSALLSRQMNSGKTFPITMYKLPNDLVDMWLLRKAALDSVGCDG